MRFGYIQKTLPLSKTLLFEQHQYAPSSDTRSEASSVASEWSDINSNFALQLGVNKEDLKDERFKIDRQKLENMIKGKKEFIVFWCFHRLF